MPEITIDAVGLLGVVMIVGAYLLLQLEKVSHDSWIYLGLNLIGASSILISLLFDWNLAAALIEIFWIGISITGLWRKATRRRSATDPIRHGRKRYPAKQS